ncbi:hypothetical protein AAG906_018580 [Vitis piasezkii]
MNSVLLCKWNWRYANEREALWRRVISLKHDEEEGGWRTWDVMGRNRVGLWKAIRKKWGLLDGRLAYHVGNGQRVRFWKDKWCGDGPLYGDGWTPLFARAFNDWEIDLVERLLQKIHAFKVQREEEDRVIWTASNDGAFSVKSLYSMLERGNSSMFPSERIWRVLSLSIRSRNDGSSLSSLCQDVGPVIPVEPSFLPFWCILNSFVYSEGNPSWMEWRVCGEKAQEGLENGSFMYFWLVGRREID